MTKPNFFTEKFKSNALHFLIYFAAAGLTPVIGWLTCSIWSWLAYGFLNELFAEIHTALLWAVEAPLFVYWEKRRNRKLQNAEKRVLVVASADEYEEAEAVETARKKKEGSLLPIKTVWLLAGICALCIFVVSAIIGFQVKPFYDMATRGSGYPFWCEIGVIGRNIFKCMWITAMLGPCKNMADEIVRTSLPPEKTKKWTAWLIAWGILMLFGIFDVFTSLARYPLTWRGWLLSGVYLLFYGVFTLVYCLTERNKYKTYFLSMLIYIF